MRRLATFAVFIALVVIAAWLQYTQVTHVNRADGAISAAQAPGPLLERVRAAAEAVRLQPQVIAYRQVHGSLLAESYVAIGSPRAARKVLIDAWSLDRTNAELRAQLREVNLEVQALDTWKAHIQHAREGPLGELDSEDVIP